MKKFGWYAVSAGVVAFVLGAGLLLALNLYVQSRAVQHRIRQALSDRLRLPVDLKKTTFTPWDGLRIDGLAARSKTEPTANLDAATNAATFLTADSFRVKFSSWALLQQKFVVEDALLDRPRLSWAQDKADRWRLPADKQAPFASNEPERVLNPSPHPADVPAARPELLPSPLPTTPSEGKFADASPAMLKPRAAVQPVEIDKFRLRHGTMDFLNHRRGLLGHFEDVNVDGHLPDAAHANGHAYAALAALPRAGLRLTNLQTAFRYDQREGVTLNNVLAGLAGGSVAGGCRLQTTAAGSPFSAQCHMENVDLDRFIKEAGGKLGLVDGHLRGNVDVSGTSDDPDRCEAAGQFELVDTRLRNFPLFQAVGTTLGIEDLRRLQFKTAQLDYQLTGGTVRIQPLVLVSSNLQITARGNYLLREDRLDLHARLVIDPAVSRQLPRLVGQQFTPCGDEAPGSRYVDFDVGGPLNKPTSNLYQRIVPNSVESVLEGLLHRRPKRPKQTAPPRDPTLPADLSDGI